MILEEQNFVDLQKQLPHYFVISNIACSKISVIWKHRRKKLLRKIYRSENRSIIWGKM